MSQPTTMGAAFLAEFDQEMTSTRRMLERVPDDKLDWRPHPRSWPMAVLASHVANLPNWAVMTLEMDSLDLAPADGSAPLRAEVAGSRQRLLELFDASIAAAHAAVEAASDERLGQTWTLLNKGQTLLTLPRIAILKTFVLNHIIHHRAQLGVYLRINDVPVPGMYGPSADETGM